MDNEKAIELSVPILCALINNGFLPAVVAKSAETAAGMVYDHLEEIAVQLQRLYRNLESGDVPGRK